jgi:cytochrome b561
VYLWSHTTIPARPRHPALVLAMHWGSVLAIVVSVAAMFVRDAIEDAAARQWLLQIHRQLGLLVLGVALVRIAYRLLKGLADHARETRIALRLAAHGAHLALYAALIALPLVGWALSSAHGISLRALGIVPLPALVAPDSELADTLDDYHVWLAWALLGLVALHAAAALWHHYMRRDAVLAAMLPGSRRTVTMRQPHPGAALSRSQLNSGGAKH